MFHVELKTFVCNIVTDYYNCIDYISFISYNILDLKRKISLNYNKVNIQYKNGMLGKEDKNEFKSFKLF